MAWSKDKALPENINKNNEFTTDNNFTIAELNAIVNNSFYGVDFVEAMADTPDVSEAGNVGTPIVTLINYVKNGKTYKKFKFSNIKGERGIQGVQGIQGVKGDKGDPNTLSIGTVTSGTTPSVTITGASPNQTINFVLPRGERGDSVELRVADGYFQWKSSEATNWTNLIAVSAIAEIDDALSASSTNAVQNRIVKAELDKKFDKTGGTVTGNIIAPQFKSDDTEAGMYFGENNELDFGSNSNILYIGYQNRLNTSGAIDTYYFGKHNGSTGQTSGKIYCGELFENGTTLKNKYVDFTSAQTISGNKTLSGTVTITGTLIV